MPYTTGIANKIDGIAQVFTPRIDGGGLVTLAYTTTKASGALPTAPRPRFVMLYATTLCHINFTNGAGTPVAGTNAMPIPAGVNTPLAVPNGATHINAVADSTGGTLYVTPCQTAAQTPAD